MTGRTSWVVLYGCGHWKVESGPPIRETTPRVCSERHRSDNMVGWSPQGLHMMQAGYVDLDAVRADPDEHWPDGTERSGWVRLRDYIDILRAAKTAPADPDSPEQNEV